MKVDKISPKMKFRYRRLRSWRYYFWLYIAILSSYLYIIFFFEGCRGVYSYRIDGRFINDYFSKRQFGYTIPELIQERCNAIISNSLLATLLTIILLIIAIFTILSIIKLIDKCLKIHTPHL